LLFIELLQCQKKKHYDIGLMIDFVKKKKFIKKLKIKALKLKVMGKCSFFYIALFIQRLLGKNCNFYFDLFSLKFIYFCWEELLKEKKIIEK
jgi:hypothetical protein